jgi:hypothetical protein
MDPHTLLGSLLGCVKDFAGYNLALDTRAAVEKPLAGNSYLSRVAVSLQLHRCDHAPESVEEDSIDRQYSCEGCSYCLDIPRDGPFCLVKSWEDKVRGPDLE